MKTNEDKRNAETQTEEDQDTRALRILEAMNDILAENLPQATEVTMFGVRPVPPAPIQTIPQPRPGLFFWFTNLFNPEPPQPSHKPAETQTEEPYALSREKGKIARGLLDKIL